jgi:hypothetical protein
MGIFPSGWFAIVMILKIIITVQLEMNGSGVLRAFQLNRRVIQFNRQAFQLKRQAIQLKRQAI